MSKHSVFLFSLHLLASLYMLGIIWFVQIVHYPMFTFLNNDSPLDPHKFHSKRTSYLVVPAMIIELGTVIWLLFRPYPNLFTVIILLLMTLAPLITTFVLQVPVHKKLGQEMNQSMINKLTHSNWLRTWLWTIKAIYLFALVWILLKR
ncbi:MAG: hypothetical protein S4CHLAM7_00140 [Chlamydiae bacterium]|nr:hypothetical protein [Chlamydiota bacterium]